MFCLFPSLEIPGINICVFFQFGGGFFSVIVVVLVRFYFHSVWWWCETIEVQNDVNCISRLKWDTSYMLDILVCNMEWPENSLIYFLLMYCLLSWCSLHSKLLLNAFFFFTVLDNKVIWVYVWLKLDNEMRQWIGRDIFYLIGNMISRDCFEMVEFILQEKRDEFTSTFFIFEWRIKNKREQNFHFFEISTEQTKITEWQTNDVSSFLNSIRK